MSQKEENLESFVQSKLEMLHQAPARKPEKAAEGRERYLAHARLAATRFNAQQPVSDEPKSRLIGWIGLIRNPYRKKERRSMIATLSSLMLVLVMLFGGAGATVYAAQDSLPNQGLYPLKIASEDLQFRLAMTKQKQLALQLAYADRRASELAALLAAGEPAPEQTATRLENHLRQAFQIASGMDADALPPALVQIRTHLRSQQRLMDMIQNSQTLATDPLLSRLRTMLRQQLNLVDEGMIDPQNFRNRLRYQYEVKSTPLPVATENSYGPGPTSSPGTQTCNECTPVMDGTGPGPGPGPMLGTQAPGSGEGQGSGQGPAATAAPGGSGGDNGGPKDTQESGGGGNQSPAQGSGGSGSSNPSQEPGGGSNGGGGQGRP